MALANYTDLQAAIASWSFGRSDLPVTDLIALAEARINADLRLRVMEAETTLTGVVGSRYIALPSRFLEALDLWLVLSDVGRIGLTPDTPDQMPAWPSNAQPRYWCVDGTNIAFEAPVDDTYSFTLRYVQALSLADTTTNWLLTNQPGIYLDACLAEAGNYLERDAKIERAEARYVSRIAVLKRQEGRARKIAGLRVDPALQAGASRGTFNIYRGD